MRSASASSTLPFALASPARYAPSVAETVVGSTADVAIVNVVVAGILVVAGIVVVVIVVVAGLVEVVVGISVTVVVTGAAVVVTGTVVVVTGAEVVVNVVVTGFVVVVVVGIVVTVVVTGGTEVAGSEGAVIGEKLSLNLFAYFSAFEPSGAYIAALLTVVALLTISVFAPSITID